MKTKEIQLQDEKKALTVAKLVVISIISILSVCLMVF